MLPFVVSLHKIFCNKFKLFSRAVLYRGMFEEKIGGGGMENHSYFHEDISFSCEAVPGAVCLLRADASEKIVEFNKELLNLYQCGSREEFLQFTHGTFRGMVLASAYCPLTAMDTLWEKREKEGPLYLDFVIRTKQGYLRHIDTYLCRLERRGQAYWPMYHRAHGQETRHPYAGRGCGDVGAGPVSALHRLREDSGYYYGRLMPYEEIQQHYGAHYPIESAQETKLYRSKRANAIHNIREVDGFPCTLYLQYAVGYASETRSIEGLLRLLVERLEEAQQSRLGASIYIGDRIAFDREKFDHMDERVYMSDPETYDLVYINEAACRDLHHRCYQHCHARGKSVRRHPENALENQLGARCRPHLHF